jgi:CoA:oxalate CoA-transferase
MSTAPVPDGGRPLDGTRVLDFTSMVSGPYCTRLLADMGATVIKVEAATGDLIRYGAPLTPAGSRYFQAFNAGKQSVVLDLKAPAAIRIATDLAAQCDVLVENFRPGVMQKLGLDYTTLRAVNPALVYCSISGFGQSGPMRDWPAYAPIVHALSGFDAAFMNSQDAPDQPPVAGIQVADVLTGAFAFGAIQSALIKRFRTGCGDHIDATLIESAMALISGDLQVPQVETPQRITTFKAVRSDDGFVMPVILTEKAFDALCRVIDPTLLDDPRFNERNARGRHWEQLRQVIEGWTSQRSGQECQDTLMAVGVPCARYMTPAEVLRNEHLQLRGSFATLDDAAGSFAINNAPFKFASTDTSIRSPAPRLGADTAQTLRSLLGMTESELAALIAAGVVA